MSPFPIQLLVSPGFISLVLTALILKAQPCCLPDDCTPLNTSELMIVCGFIGGRSGSLIPADSRGLVRGTKENCQVEGKMWRVLPFTF